MVRPTGVRDGFSGLLASSLFVGACIADVADPPIVDVPLAPDAPAGRRLAAILARMSPFDATTMAAIVALSPYVEARHTIAEALALPFPLVGDDFVLDHLVGDSDPRVREAAARARAARGLHATPPPVAVRPPPPRVLVIDDYPGCRTALSAWVTDLGYEALSGSSKVAHHDVPWHDIVDVVVTNHDPPWTDSLRVIDELRRRAPHLPAVVLSDRTLGGDPFANLEDELTLVRPFRFEDLEHAIHAVAARTG